MSYEAMIPIVYPEVSCDLLVKRIASGHPQFFLLMLVKFSESLEALTSPLLSVLRKRKGNREAVSVSRFRGKYFVFEIGFSRLQVSLGLGFSALQTVACQSAVARYNGILTHRLP